MHTFICGATRSGKSEAELTRLVPLACRGDCAIVLMDPPGTLAAKFLLHLQAQGLLHRVIYDRLADTDRVPSYDWLVPSRHPDPLRREAENDERVRDFVAILTRRRGIQDTAHSPLIEEVLLNALQLYVHQAHPVPIPWLADLFDVQSAARVHLLANCVQPEVVRKIREYGALSLTARRREIAPAERILRNVCTSPSFRARSGPPTVNLDHFLDQRGILILDGSSRGDISRDAVTVMMGALILKVIQHCRAGAMHKVVLILDEAHNAGLLGLHESRALAEAGKWGLEFHVIVQDPFSFASEEIRSNTLQNTWRHEWYRQGSPLAAQLAADDIGTTVLDPLKVHHVEYRSRMVDVGFERVRTTSQSVLLDATGHTKGRSKHWSTTLWPRRSEVKEMQERYSTLADQVTLLKKELMLLHPGYRFVRADETSRLPEYTPMLHWPWEKNEGQATEDNAMGNFVSVWLDHAIQTIKQGPAFRAPASVATPIPRDHADGAAHRVGRQVAIPTISPAHAAMVCTSGSYFRH